MGLGPESAHPRWLITSRLILHLVLAMSRLQVGLGSESFDREGAQKHRRLLETCC